MTTLSRRSVLAGGLGVAGALGVASGGLLGTASADAAEPGWSGAVSLNGWPVVPAVPSFPVEGTDLAVAVLPGDVATTLLHCARRFCYELGGSLAPGDITGHTPGRAVAAGYESNHLSGTAITIRQSAYPRGAAGGFFPQELVVVRDILAECEGVVRWGGDLSPVKESHLQIDVPPGDARLSRVAAKIAGWKLEPGAGAGSDLDPFTEPRRATARLLARAQGAR
ncbi:hypothetical protein SAMN04489727_6980 [Amycolatopsis tolypomycina]|uniref:Uncharacterized protein n=1 Tax=Amycolatopsis tolypomycina TaxID=208445 RepID=A0A1H4YYI1_9PSEU|nr:hypothetical protein [Amycolatopsis tolypomycina]SED22767.1 hypothetical protein SAMN04489727_6980 [Amycolatopsis tolypomycina]